MTGYNPNCDNCHRCGTCQGDGTVQTAKSDRGESGKPEFWYERVTCSSCKGRGGSAGSGKHDHR
jgi:hypothetical protein